MPGRYSPFARAPRSGSGVWRSSRNRLSMLQRNAVSVLPEPVGDTISTCSPREMAGQPSSCGRGGARNDARNQEATGGEKSVSGTLMGSILAHIFELEQATLSVVCHWASLYNP